jgi:hypothetical protein
MGRLLLNELFLASVYLLDAMGLADLYQLYCDLLREFGVCVWLDDPFPHRKVDSVRPYR